MKADPTTISKSQIASLRPPRVRLHGCERQQQQPRETAAQSNICTTAAPALLPHADEAPADPQRRSQRRGRTCAKRTRRGGIRW